MMLCHCSPLPPRQNGIADYAAKVAVALSKSFPTIVCDAGPFVDVPAGITVLDPAQAFRLDPDETLFVHHIGNNADHVHVRKLALARPGIVVIHDLRLLWLYNHCGLSDPEFLAALARSNPPAAPGRLPAIQRKGLRSFDYLLFDVLDEIVRSARGIVVHSEFGRRQIALRFGAEVASRVSVIPHFAFDPPRETKAQARLRLGLEPDAVVVATFGFAARAKRYDLVVDAIAALAPLERNLVWLQAGPVRADEYDLESAVRAKTAVARVTRFTGYIPAHDLDGYVAAADVAVNLRYPSLGENSGSLSRLLSAGVPCVVTDTAAYAEMPDDVVVKLPIDADGRDLARVIATLLEHPEEAVAIGAAARRLAEGPLAFDRYVEAFRAVIAAARARRPIDRGAGHANPELHIDLDGASFGFEALADSAMPVDVECLDVELVGGDPERVRLRLADAGARR